jgi:hypothetical protein
LAFGREPEAVPAFNSFFDRPSDSPSHTADARDFILAWSRTNANAGAERGTLVIVTHQVNISALTGRSTQSSEAIVLDVIDNRIVVLGAIKPPA